MHEFTLSPPAPFSFEATAAFLSPGPDEVVDVYDGKRYTRLLDVSGRIRLALVSSLGTVQRPELIVTLMNGTERDEPGVVGLLGRMLGMSFELREFYQMCRQDQGLYGLSSDYYGLRPPQRMHPFECLTLAIMSKPGLHLFRTSISATAEAISHKVAYAGDTFFAFPNPRVIAKRNPEDLVHGSVTREQAKRLHSLATAVLNGDIDLVALTRAPLEVLVERLARIDGVGLVGAQLTALLGYGRLDGFPSADPLLLEWIGRNYRDGGPIERFEAEEWAAPWGKYRGLVALHIYAELMRKKRL